MRNFEQRIAEINRRSDAIQAMRKKRKKQFTAVCIPLILCVTVVSALFLPGLQEKQAIVAESSGITEDATNSMNSSSGISTRKDGLYITTSYYSGSLITEEQVSQICDLLYSITQESQENNGQNPDTEADQSGSDNQLEEEINYLIELIENGQTTFSYVLTGYLLKDVKTGATYTLSERQVKTLTDLIGL